MEKARKMLDLKAEFDEGLAEITGERAGGFGLESSFGARPG